MSYAKHLIGYVPFSRHNWGHVAQCPHCPATNIRRVNKRQITCGSPECRRKQNNLRNQRELAGQKNEAEL